MKLTDIVRVVTEKTLKLKPDQLDVLLKWIENPKGGLSYVIPPGEAASYPFDATTVTFLGDVPPAQIYINPSQGSNRRSGESPKGAIKSFRELSTRLEGQGRTLTDGEILETIAELALKLRSKGSKLRLVEGRIVDHANSQTKGNRSAAARLLGIERKAFERRVTR